MALAFPISEFGPVCDYFVGQQIEGPIESVDVMSKPRINLGQYNFDFQFEAPTSDVDGLNASNNNGDDGTDIPEPNISVSLNDLILTSGIITNPLTPEFGPVCDRTPPDSDDPNFLGNILNLDNRSQPNIIFNVAGDADGFGGGLNRDDRVSPNLCRSVKRNQFQRSENFGPVCDISQGSNQSGGNYECPDGGDGSIILPKSRLDTFTPPGGDPGGITNNPLIDDFSPRIRCFTNAAGATICYPQDLPNFPEPDDINWPDYSDDQLGGRNLDRQRLRKRETRFSTSLYCSIRESFDSWGVFLYPLPLSSSSCTIRLWGAGGGSGGFDRGDITSNRSVNNSGGSGDYISIDVDVDPTLENILTIVIGQGGRHGIDLSNNPTKTRAAFNRGGKGGHPGSSGLSGGGGGGGGATDVYLNGRLIASVAGGGGGGGQGCLGFNPSTSGKPYGNWNQYSWDPENPTDESETLEITRFAPILSLPLQRIEPHPTWSNFMKEYVVWPSIADDARKSNGQLFVGENALSGQVFDGRINLSFNTAGTYTFKMAADNAMAVYIAPYVESAAEEYITDPYEEVFNGGQNAISSWITNGGRGDTIPTPPSSIDGFTLVGWTTDFLTDPPNQYTYSVSSPGRYVLKVVFFNETDDGGSASSWTKNPGGIALQILKPNGTQLWSTRTYYGIDGNDVPRGDDGPGAGAGGGNAGVAGLTSVQLGLTGGSCSNRDATCQGGSGGKTWVLDHPSVSINDFKHAVNGSIEGWNKPGSINQSGRKSFGGPGGGRPKRFSLIFNGNEYPLTNSNGNFITATIPGFGNGVWNDEISGSNFTTTWAWGTPIGDSDGINSIPNITRSAPNDPRYFQLNFRINPVKSGNSWTTKLTVTSIPDYGKGTSWKVNDTLTARFPQAYTDGTVPYLDDDLPTNWERGRYLVGSLRSDADQPVRPNTYIEFQIKITEVVNDVSSDGESGAAVVVAYYTVVTDE